MADDPTPDAPLGLFEGYGVEIEHMIVDAETLSVKPVCDQLLAELGGGFEAEVERGPCAWSNELARHVLEFKTNGPAPTLEGLAAMFQENVDEANRRLAPLGARLLPTGMHPWMDPERELELWPHEYGAIYQAYDRIFDCRGHGWANLQSVHLNLPFRDDAEFARLHAAIRLVLPLVPGLAASTPVQDGALADPLDARLIAYRHNSDRVPEVAGQVVPERVYSRQAYEEQLLGSVYAALAPHDPEGVLRGEWVNSRGAIARFDRMAIEVRLVDTQECPRADLAMVAALAAAIRALVEGRWGDLDSQRSWDEARLARILWAGVEEGDEAWISDEEYLAVFDYPEEGAARTRDLWAHLVDQTLRGRPGWSEWQAPLEAYLARGCLATRIRAALGPDPAARDLRRVYGELAECLAAGEVFGGG